MRRLLLGGLIALLPTFAFADASISGQWQADLEQDKKIDMDILADGHWHSQNIQNDNVVRQLSGTYAQTRKSDTTGEIVFTPTAGDLQAKVETDEYTLSDGGKTLELTSEGDTMTFHKESIEEKEK